MKLTMETKDDLERLERHLADIKYSHKQTTAYSVLFAVILAIFVIYIASFLIKKEVHEAIRNENLSGLVENGFEQAISNFEIVE